MRLALFATLLAMPVIAEQPKFDVKEIPAESVKVLQRTESELEEATALLNQIVKVVEQAKKNFDDTQKLIKSPFGEYEGECKRDSQPTLSDGVISTVYIVPTRKFKRVELRGRFALITEGTEECGYSIGNNLGWIPAGGTVTLTSDGLANFVGHGDDPGLPGDTGPVGKE